MKKTLILGLALAAAPLLALAETPAKPKTGAAAPAAAVKKAPKAKKKAPVQAAKHQHWVCPMHDGGESDHAGKCPKCGMDLVLEK